MSENLEIQATLQMIWSAVRLMPEITNDISIRDGVDKLLKAKSFQKNRFIAPSGLFNVPNNPFFTSILTIFGVIESQKISLIHRSDQTPLQLVEGSGIEFFLQNNLPTALKKLFISRTEFQINDLLKKAKNEFQVKLKQALSQSENDELFVVKAKSFLNEIASKLPSFWGSGLINAQEIKIFWGAYNYLIINNPVLVAKLPLDMPPMRLYQHKSDDCSQQFLNFLEQAPILSAALKNARHDLQRKSDLLQVTLQMVWQVFPLKDAILEETLKKKPFDRQKFLMALIKFKGEYYSNLISTSQKEEKFSATEQNNILKAIAILEEILTSNELLIHSLQTKSDLSMHSLPKDIWEIIFAELAEFSSENLSLFIEDPEFRKIWESLKNKSNSPFKNTKLAQNAVWVLNKTHDSDLKFDPETKDGISRIIECQHGLVSISHYGALMYWRLNNNGIFESKKLDDSKYKTASNTVMELRDGLILSTDPLGQLFLWSFDNKEGTYILKSTGTHARYITAIFELSNDSVISFSEQPTLMHTFFDKNTNRYKHNYIPISQDTKGCVQVEDGSLIRFEPTKIIHMFLNLDGSLGEKELPLLHGENIDFIIQLKDGSLVVVDGETFTRVVYNSENHNFEKIHTMFSIYTILSNGRIEKIIQLSDGSLVTCSLRGTVIQWAFNPENEDFTIKQVLGDKLGSITSLVQLQEKSLICTTLSGAVISWKLNSQTNSFNAPIYIEAMGSDTKVCQLQDGSLIIGNEIGALRQYTLETLKEVFKKNKAVLKKTLKATLQKQGSSFANNAEFFNDSDPLEKQKCYLRTVLSKQLSLLAKSPYIKEQEIKIFLGAYQYLIFKDPDLSEDKTKLNQFCKLMEVILALPIFTLYKDDTTCLQEFADFLSEKNDLPSSFDEARLFLHASQRTLGNI